MDQVTFHDQDRKQITSQGMTEAAVHTQIETFRRGFPFTQLHRPCTVGNGISITTPQDATRLTALYTQAAQSGRLQKFVPAAGAASRMFQFLLATNNQYDTLDIRQPATAEQAQDPEYQAFLRFANDLPKFAFYDSLRLSLDQQGQRLETLVQQGQFKEILNTLLTPLGLNYANLPKGLLPFHRYPEHCRTALEEHFVEAAALVRTEHQIARLHFAVSPNHLETMETYARQVQPQYEQTGTRYEMTWSVQKSSTDTIAVTPENQPFRDREGQLLFRPAGHGALLENLHDLQGDLIVIKNIDNTVPDDQKGATYHSTQLLGGYLIEVQQQAFQYLEYLAAQQVKASLLHDIRTFTQDKLSIALPEGFEHNSHDTQIEKLFSALNRPLRVCGVVPNTGEPGGGPFWVANADGHYSAQIVETSQVDSTNPDQQALLAAATHFNPVHLVCGVRDYLGQPFDLRQFVDANTGFISQKSSDGRPLKAMELPGLWNGAMAHWNTIFIEVPLESFNPVKTVLDLLRPEHQPL